MHPGEAIVQPQALEILGDPAQILLIVAVLRRLRTA